MKGYLIRFITAVMFALVFIINIIFNNQFNGSILLKIIALFMILIGTILWISGIITLGKNFTVSVKPKGLVSTGIYSKIRHPMYYGGIIIYLGLGLFFKSIIGLILTIVLVTPFAIYSNIKEEKALIVKYKEKYIAYKKKTLF